MFSINESLKDLKVKERNIFKILYSMNSHPVAMPGYASEEARCYILFFSEGPNLSAFIGLYLTHVDQKFFYTYGSNPFPFEAQSDVEDEAKNFAEEMGFLLDEINVSGMAVDDRNHWIEEQLIFGYKSPETEKKEEKPASPAAAPQATVAQEAETPAAIEEIEVPLPHTPTPEPAPQQAQMPQAPVVPAAAPPQQPLAYQPVAPQPVQTPYQTPQPPAGYQPQPPVVQTPQAPAPAGYPPQPQQPAVQPQQPEPQAYYPAPGPAPAAPHPPLELHTPPVLEAPLLEHPEDVETATQQKPQAKASPPKAPVKKKISAKAAPLPLREEGAEEEVSVEYEVEAHDTKPRSLFEEAIKQGVVKPPKPKAAKTAHTATGVVPRDKEALARLLASF